jgi:PhoPQ-activated pathogenicity-related protein
MARHTWRRFRSLLLTGGLLALFPLSRARADLLEYVQKPEPHFAWKLNQKIETPLGAIYDIELTSQTWEGIDWTHQLQVYQPAGVDPTATMLLFNTGGKSSPGSIAMGLGTAKQIGAPVAILYGIPNQPLLDGKKEDALIAETFVRFLDTKDADWPLLFPMAKSVVKAMDALQEFSKQEWKTPVKSFVVSGASKRGWTTWLSGAADPRVVAIAPMVIDTLNMVQQMAHQKETLGEYSEMIHDYTDRGLVPIPPKDEAKRLWKMIDPYFYRDKLKMPKLLINGANDRYWSTDALNLYWDDLSGDKWVTYVPNAGHNLEQGGDEKTPGDRSWAMNALAAFARAQITGKGLPTIIWKQDDADGKMRLTVTAKPAATAAHLYVATGPTRDFRKATWVERPATIDKETVTGAVDPPADGCEAFFGVLDYEIDGIKYHLCTQMRVAGAAKP